MAIRNVHKQDVTLIGLPVEAIAEDRGLSFCKKPQLVLASTSDAISYKNDRTAIAYKFDSMTVELEDKAGNVTPALGAAVNFPYQSDAVGFVIDWRQVVKLDGTLAQGCYRVKINWELAGNSGSFYYGSFELLEYSILNAAKTVRLYVVLNDLVRKQGINYKDSGFAGTVRFEGKFGYMQPNYDTENNIHVDRTRYKVRNEALRTYELRSNYMLSCMSRLIDEEKLLAANQIYITDHNATNHVQHYYDFPVILSEDESPSFEYTDTVYAKIKALFLDKVAVHESKYDGNIQGSENVILELPTAISTPATVESSDASAYQTTVQGGATLVLPDETIQIEDEDGNILETLTNPYQKDITVEVNSFFEAPFWVRNFQWLDLPDVNVGNNQFYGLYAVFENDPLGNTITIDTLAGLDIDWGDGNSVTSVLGVNTHVYNYATISGAVLTSFDGRNYKQVIVSHDITGVSVVGLEDAAGVGKNRTTGWLDIICGGSSLRDLRVSGNIATSIGIAAYLERFRVVEMNPASSNAVRSFYACSSIKVVDYPVLNNSQGFNSVFSFAPDVRDSNNNPLSLTGTSGVDLRVSFLNSGITQLGDINYPTCTVTASAFNSAKIEKIGNINLPNATELISFFQSSSIRTVGTITVGTSLTTIFRFALSAFSLQGVEFSGDMSNVSGATSAFGDCLNLERLITPNLTIGIDVSDTSLTGQNLQDWFTSLGTASGSQTITLPLFTSGEPTAIATGKGYTIAYA